MYISTVEMYYCYLAATTYRMRCIFQQSPDKNNTSHQLKYTSFHLKYIPHSLSGGRQIYLAAISGGRQIGIIHLPS